MKTIKSISIIASTIIFTLIALALNQEDPLKANYRNTVDDMMKMENVQAETEIMEMYPALSEAKASIERSDQLKSIICAKTSAIAPALTRQEESELKQMQEEVIQLRQAAGQMLKELQAHEAIAVNP